MTQALSLNYDEVGATGRTLPVGYRHLNRNVRLGRGRARFERARDRLANWEMHRDAGLRVTATSPHQVIGSDVQLTMSLGPFRIGAACRVIDVLDEPDHYSFAYGTLERHPEQGEERFSVRMETNDDVTFHIVAFSRPGTTWTRLAPWLTEAVQDRMTARYLLSAAK